MSRDSESIPCPECEAKNVVIVGKTTNPPVSASFGILCHVLPSFASSFRIGVL